MWLSSLFSVLKAFLSILAVPLSIVLVVIVIFIILYCIWFIYYTCKGMRLKKGSRVFVKKDGFFKKLFFKLPQRMVLDNFDRNPDFFRYQGLVIFEGRQGSGKTISMIEYARTMQQEYPKSLCTTNLAYTGEDMPLKDWRMLLRYKNGIFGVIVCMDEL